MPELVVTKRAKRDLAALPRKIQEAVFESLTLLQGRPEELGKQLRGRFRGLWSYRVGSYRIPYTIEGAEARSRVVVRRIRHRSVAYGRGR